MNGLLYSCRRRHRLKATKVPSTSMPQAMRLLRALGRGIWVKDRSESTYNISDCGEIECLSERLLCPRKRGLFPRA